MTKRKVTIEGQHYAGQGGDGGEFAVTTLNVKATGKHVKRRKPCASCPWRKDAPIGAFPAEAFRHSAATAYDGAFNTFACHESGAEKPATCAGFLLRNARNNIGVRLGLSYDRLTLDDVTDAGVELYDSYEAMAVANGVDPLDPVLDQCRADDDYTGRHIVARERAEERKRIGWKPSGG